MRILNLYAGIGGNRKLWGDKHKITAVEMDTNIACVYRDLFPNDEVIVGDAHEYLLQHYQEFDFIWSSPPCQSHSKMVKATRHDIRMYPDMSLYQEVIYLRNFFNGLFVVENVKPYYMPLIEAKIEIGRHLFWSNFFITKCNAPTIGGFINKGTVEDSETLKEWLGMKYPGNLYYEGNHCPSQVLRNCVHPEIGLHVLNCALEHAGHNPKDNRDMGLFDSLISRRKEGVG